MEDDAAVTIHDILPILTRVVLRVVLSGLHIYRRTIFDYRTVNREVVISTRHAGTKYT
jgi:hypothetical protein